MEQANIQATTAVTLWRRHMTLLPFFRYLATRPSSAPGEHWCWTSVGGPQIEAWHMVNHMVIACDSRLIRKNITFATDLNSVASMKTEFEWFIFASKAKARKSIHFQRYHHTCLTFSLSARRDGKFVKSRPPPDATGQAYGTSEALAPANPSRTSLDIVGLASFYKLSGCRMLSCFPVSTWFKFWWFCFWKANSINPKAKQISRNFQTQLQSDQSVV